MSGSITTAFGKIACHVVNLSVGGLGIVVDSAVRLKLGDRIDVAAREIGAIDCVVRWAAHPKYGVEFSRSGRLPAAVQSFYDSLPGGE